MSNVDNPLTLNSHNNYIYKSVPLLDGFQVVFHFYNGYGASVIKHSGSYGGRDGLFELAVLKIGEDSSELVYDTEVNIQDDNHDVYGYLEKQEVIDLLTRIEAMLPCEILKIGNKSKEG